MTTHVSCQLAFRRDSIGGRKKHGIHSLRFCVFLLLRRVFVLLISLLFSPFPLRGYVNVRTNSQRQQRRQRSAIGRIGRRSVARRIGTTAPRRAPPPPPPTGACSSSDVALRCDVRGRVVYTGPPLLHTPLPAPGSSCCRAVDLPCATSYTSAHNTLHGHYTQTPTLPEQLPLFRSLSLAHAQTVVCVCVGISFGIWPNFLSAHGHTRAAQASL